MKTNYLIVDATANGNAIYINSQSENCNLVENAMIFATKEEAEREISNNSWEDWAEVKETKYPANSHISL